MKSLLALLLFLSTAAAAQDVDSALASEGFSGGPVLRSGQVVGVVTGEDAQLTYAVSALIAREF